VARPVGSRRTKESGDGGVFGLSVMHHDVRIGIVDCLERYLVYELRWWLDWKGVQSTEEAVVGTRCMTWECGWLGKVPRVQNGNVDDLERCLKYGLGCGHYPACEIGSWMA
jgi:hypothetical protein